MSQAHVRDGVSESERHVRMPEMQERLMIAEIRDQKRHDGGSQHDRGSLRGRAGELQQFVKATLVSLHLLNIESLVVTVVMRRCHGGLLSPR